MTQRYHPHDEPEKLRARIARLEYQLEKARLGIRETKAWAKSRVEQAEAGAKVKVLQDRLDKYSKANHDLYLEVCRLASDMEALKLRNQVLEMDPKRHLALPDPNNRHLRSEMDYPATLALANRGTTNH
jgi:hypothetical protein